jgi:hypothetical protein
VIVLVVRHRVSPSHFGSSFEKGAHRAEAA